MNARVNKIEGDQRVDSLELISVGAASMSQPMMLQTDGVFIAVGNVPDLSMLKDLDGIQFDDGGYLMTDERCRSHVPGLFVAGDVRAKGLRQIAQPFRTVLLPARKRQSILTDSPNNIKQEFYCATHSLLNT